MAIIERAPKANWTPRFFGRGMSNLLSILLVHSLIVSISLRSSGAGWPRNQVVLVPLIFFLTRRNLLAILQASVSPPPPPRQSRWQGFLQFVGKATLITTIGGVGALYYITQREKNPGPQLPFDPDKKTLVILGSGWGATSLLKNLDTADFNVVRHCLHHQVALSDDFWQVVVSPRNFFLFTPLLPSVAVGTLNNRSIIQSIRYITRHKARNVSVIEAEATDVDVSYF